MPQKPFFSPAVIGWLLLTLAAAGLFVRLGFWQLDRADQKRQILQGYADAAQIQVNQVNAQTPVYSKVTGEITLLSEQLLLDNQILRGRPGVHVLTPALLDDQRLLLINRGWLPMDSARSRLPDAPIPESSVVLYGQLAPLPRVGRRLGEQTPLNTQQWPQLITYADQDVIEQAYRVTLNLPDLQLLPWVLQLDADAEHGFAGRDWSPVNFGPKKHLAYAWQWFTLALAVLITWVVVTRISRRNSNRNGHE